MKVLCIDGVILGTAFQVLYGGIYNAGNEDLIFSGNIYTVIEQVGFKNKIYYRLEEKPRFNFYLNSRFIPCSDIDETEMVREKQFQTT